MSSNIARKRAHHGVQLAHQVREGRLAEEHTVLRDGCLTQADRAIGLTQCLGDLIDEVVLLGGSDWCGARQTIVQIIFLVHLASDERAHNIEDSDKECLSHPYEVGTILAQ